MLNTYPQKTRTFLVSQTQTNLGNRTFSAAGPLDWNLSANGLVMCCFTQSPKICLLGQWDYS